MVPPAGVVTVAVAVAFGESPVLGDVRGPFQFKVKKESRLKGRVNGNVSGGHGWP